MKNILIIFIGFLLSFGLFSCETIVDDLPLNRFPEIKEKLVLTSFISPQDTTIYVKVTVSTPLFGEYKSSYSGFYVANGDTVFYGGKSNVIPDAVVTLATGSQRVTLPFDSKNQLYAISTNRFKIEAGKTYTLKAVLKDNQVEASTTIPLENVKIDSYKADSTGRITYNKDTVSGYEVQFSWKDIAQKANFYKIYGEFEYTLDYPNVVNNVVTYRTQKASNNYLWYGEKSYIDDDFQDGKIINSPKDKAYKYGYSSISSNGKTYKPKPSKISSKLKLQLSNLSKEYYDYIFSLAKFNEANNNPFAEPAPVFSNVKNGLGCFAGYNRFEIIVPLK